MNAVKTLSFLRSVLTLSVVLTAFVSCSKNGGNDDSSSSKIHVRFTANGVAYQWQSVSTSERHGTVLRATNASPAPPDDGYQLSLESKPEQVNFYVFLKTASLTVGDYTSPSAAVTGYTQGGLVLKNIIYAPFSQDDYIKVTITKIGDKKVSGSFSAVLHEFNGSTVTNNKMEITNGVFENIDFPN